ncbi:MAG: KilA-N domain-containing protein [Candidatus Gracilibacteria bacterium]|nr:KilA-N domain-containing protein [Candidatus Gracilibacteria bacterium]
MTTQFQVLGIDINHLKFKDEDYICITDMLKGKDGDFFVSDWLRNRNTIEFLSIWEEVNNPTFNYGECAIIKSNAGLNNYKISVKEWTQKTNAIGIVAKTGRYGGTYAHKDIAFEFGMWISPKFKIYLIKEFQRLKQDELKFIDWNVKRFLTKVNYKIHTDAIKENLIPKILSKNEINFIYADEADILNKALFGITAKEYREQNPGNKGNIRDDASIEQLIILANIESMNAEFIKMGIKQTERLETLNKVAITQMKSLLNINIPENLKIIK